MDEGLLTEQLDQAIEAMLRSPEAQLQSADPQIAGLLGIADELRTLPRAALKLSLKDELVAATSVSTESTETESGDELESKVSERYRTVTPYLTVADVHEEIDFITKVFGAKGQVYGLGSAGGFHSEYKIGD